MQTGASHREVAEDAFDNAIAEHRPCYLKAITPGF